MSGEEWGIRFAYLWHDIHMMEIRVSVSNALFHGTAEIYVNHDALKEVADEIRGFPATPSDQREVKLGSFDPELAAWAVELQFYCRDSVGHALVDARLKGSTVGQTGTPQSAFIVVPVEAAGIDEFVKQLLMFAPDPEANAYLPARM